MTAYYPVLFLLHSPGVRRARSDSLALWRVGDASEVESLIDKRSAAQVGSLIHDRPAYDSALPVFVPRRMLEAELYLVGLEIGYAPSYEESLVCCATTIRLEVQ